MKFNTNRQKILAQFVEISVLTIPRSYAIINKSPEGNGENRETTGKAERPQKSLKNLEKGT